MSEYEPETLLCSLTWYDFSNRHGAFNHFASVEFLVKVHQGKAEHGGGTDGDKGGYAIDAHCYDCARYERSRHVRHVKSAREKGCEGV